MSTNLDNAFPLHNSFYRIARSRVLTLTAIANHLDKLCRKPLSWQPA